MVLRSALSVRQRLAPWLDSRYVVGEDAALGARSVGHFAEAIALQPSPERLGIPRAMGGLMPAERSEYCLPIATAMAMAFQLSNPVER
jgi:hypothetical protein